MDIVSRGIMGAIVWLFQFSGSYGVAIMLFAIVLKVVLLPVTLYGMRWQEKFKHSFVIAKEQIAGLTTSDPEKRDDEILDIYQANGINFTNQSKALLPFLIQIPLLVAFYKTVVSWDVMSETSFLWMKDLSATDSLFALGFTLPWLGGQFNVLPFVLFAVNSGEVLFFRDGSTSAKSFALPVIFFFLFYPFPASCMIFWIMLNVVHVFERWFFVARMSEMTRQPA